MVIFYFILFIIILLIQTNVMYYRKNILFHLFSQDKLPRNFELHNFFCWSTSTSIIFEFSLRMTLPIYQTHRAILFWLADFQRVIFFSFATLQIKKLFVCTWHYLIFLHHIYHFLYLKFQINLWIKIYNIYIISYSNLITCIICASHLENRQQWTKFRDDPL